jgi:hypothetical protein
MMGSDGKAIDVAEAGRPLEADPGVRVRPNLVEGQQIIPQLAGVGVVEDSGGRLEGNEKHAPFRHHTLHTNRQATDPTSCRGAGPGDIRSDRHGKRRIAWSFSSLSSALNIPSRDSATVLQFVTRQFLVLLYR